MIQRTKDQIATIFGTICILGIYYLIWLNFPHHRESVYGLIPFGVLVIGYLVWKDFLSNNKQYIINNSKKNIEVKND